MIGSALIVFREVLEAALVIGIACAATRGIPRRGAWVALGIAGGTIGACIVAAFAEVIANFASGMGQELLNASILLAAVAMLGWHNVWMARHGREMAQEMSALGKAVHAGARPLYTLGTVIGLAVLREGSEVVLFLYGLSAGGSSNAGMVAGSLLGLAGGTALGFILYFGLLRIPTKHFFTVTSWMILLLAAGMASQAAGFLVQADWLPSWGALWDSSRIVAPDSVPGKILQTLVGYDAHPSGMQLLFYLVTLTTIGVSMKLFGKPPVAARAALPILAAVAVAGMLAPDRADANPADHVYKPYVVQGETEIEFRGGYLKDQDPAVNTGQAYVVDIGHGFTPWWFTEAVLVGEKIPGESLHSDSVEWENVLQITEPGEQFVDLGFFIETEFPLDGHTANTIEGGPVLAKQIGRFANTLDLFAENQFGSNAEHQATYSYRFETHYLNGWPVELGAQAYGEHGGRGQENVHLLGPAVFGETRLSGKNKLKWEAAVLRGLTDQTEDWRFRWTLELEFY